MPTLLRGHEYRNRNQKGNNWVNTICPVEDREVSKELFDAFEDISAKKQPTLIEPEYHTNAMAAILKNAGVDKC